MTSLESALITVAELLLEDAKRLRDEDLGFDIPVTAEVVTGYGLLIRLMVRHRGAEGITPEGEKMLMQKLVLIKKAAEVSHMILLDSSQERIQKYEEEFEKIASM